MTSRSAAQIAIETVREFLKNDDSIRTVFFVCFDSENFDIYKTLLSFLKRFPA
ncbi:macro domain-containing protein [Leptospira ellisii]|uniref:hypothetical protein n=1 Tax=Leptospira ellisii TaxID=2023197 RepID=UPI001A9C4C06